MGGNKGNPRGHFEDLDFYTFNEAILKRNHKTFLVQDTEGLRDFTLEDIEQADQLINQRADKPIWGWKDPRTALFLDFWDERIPQACYVFLYRHPIAVVHSLLRRGAVYPENDPLAGMNAWCAYNQEIINFTTKHPERCFLGNIAQITRDLSGFIERINQKFDLVLNPNSDPAIFHSDELKQTPHDPAVLETIRWVKSEPFLIFERLEEIADIPGASRPVGLTLDQDFSNALYTVILKQLAHLESTEAQLNYLFTLIDPNLASSRATSLNNLILEQQTLFAEYQKLSAALSTTIERDTRELEKREAEYRKLSATLSATIENEAREFMRRDQEIQKLSKQVQELNAALHSLKERLQNQEARAQSLQVQAIESDAKIQALSAAANHLKVDLDLAIAEATRYAASSSWRLSRPFRKLAGLLRRSNHV